MNLRAQVRKTWLSDSQVCPTGRWGPMGLKLATQSSFVLQKHNCHHVGSAFVQGSLWTRGIRVAQQIDDKDDTVRPCFFCSALSLPQT